jgi:hypothetical protein
VPARQTHEPVQEVLLWLSARQIGAVWTPALSVRSRGSCRACRSAALTTSSRASVHDQCSSALARPAPAQ